MSKDRKDNKGRRLHSGEMLRVANLSQIVKLSINHVISSF